MTAGAWLELLRISALFTVPGDALAGAAGHPLNRGTAYAIASSLCLYEAGMALNDWADREEDAIDRPHRPIPSGRISAGAALGASMALTGAGLALASRAGGRALGVSAALAATVWSYDLVWKRTPAGPAAMGAARALDVLMGAVATGPGVRHALTPAALMGAHTYAVTTVSRHEVEGGSTRAPLAALAVTSLISAAAAGLASRCRENQARPAIEDTRPEVAYGGAGGEAPAYRGSGVWGAAPHAAEPHMAQPGRGGIGDMARAAATPAALAYLATATRPYLHAALNPSPPLTQRAVGAGIRAMIPLQSALAARTGATGTAAAIGALAPLARKLARKVSPT
ncbi:SCO3242 family prenyltransferase [Streptomyces sp. NPDC050738]|uniref:SCO3242 family prenyltransferase n=1 Tax=Streptomyces sp. NPDC050738 TaxID=3154744 RepID=UPI0034483A2A